MGTLSNGRVIEFLNSHSKFKLIQNTTLLKWKFFAVTGIQTGVPAATRQSTKHYRITASYQRLLVKPTHALTETCTSCWTLHLALKMNQLKNQLNLRQLVRCNSLKKFPFSVKLEYLNCILTSFLLSSLQILKTPWLRKAEDSPLWPFH